MANPKPTLPAALSALWRSQDFWNAFFWDREADSGDASYPELADCTLRFEVALGWALMLSLDEDMSSVELSIESPSGESGELGWDDQAQWHPHALRWEELDLICRALAVRDPAASHPGIPLLLLCRFAPICSEADAKLAFPLLEAAWRELGVFGERPGDRLKAYSDARAAGFAWRAEEGRWVLTQDDQEAELDLCTLRSLENDEFPFGLLQSLLRAAEETVISRRPR